MRIAIIGGGFAGLAVAWFIVHYTTGSSTVDLYDPEPIAGGASGLSSGLLHIYTGKHARPAWEGKNCLNEAHRLITVASQAIAHPIVLSKGILRPAVSDRQITDFQACAQLHPDTEWWDKRTCETKMPGLRLPPHGGALFIKEGLTLDVNAYLNGLWQACAFHAATHHRKMSITTEDLAPYDRVLVAMGALTKNFAPLKNLPITPVKGQNIELKWPTNIPPLPFSLNSQKYIVMRPDQRSCLVGSTYEHQFTSPNAERELALNEIMPNIIDFFPALKDAEVLAVRAAFRASTPNHLPLVGKISEKFYFFTGLGSKGLLYHAWVGKHVARAMLSSEERHFPNQIYYKLKT
jgi:glycine/D-amino acid oxidase-like deaminating enzyme